MPRLDPEILRLLRSDIKGLTARCSVPGAAASLPIRSFFIFPPCLEERCELFVGRGLPGGSKRLREPPRNERPRCSGATPTSADGSPFVLRYIVVSFNLI